VPVRSEKNPARPEFSGPENFLPVTYGVDKIVRLVRIYRENSGAIPVWGPGNFLNAGMNAPDRSGRVLLGLARPFSYRLRAVGGAGLCLMGRPGAGEGGGVVKRWF